MLNSVNLVTLATITAKNSNIKPSQILSLSTVFYLAILNTLMEAPRACAQVIPDGTLSTQVTTSDNQNFTIEAGDSAGNNLFHSFSEFSIPTNGSAVFTNANTIENIFSRVTGNTISDIDGLIQANGPANVFLLNPNGILFGENASLNIGGSFVATTAERILFNDTTDFSAVDTASGPLLTVSTPVGLGLGTSPGAITVTGPGHNLILDFNSFTPIRDSRPVGLQVNTGNTLALIGGDILLAGGNLTTNQGRIELGSVAQADTVTLNPTTDGFTFDYDKLNRFGDLWFTEAASVDVSGTGSGNLHLQAENLFLLDGSAIISNVLGADNGGEVRVQVSDSVEIRGGQIYETLDNQLDEFPSSFFNQGEVNSTGQVGDLIFDVGVLRIVDGAQIDGTIAGQGNGGRLTIRANDLEMNGVNAFDVPSLIIVDAVERAEGNAESVDIKVIHTLNVQDGAQINSNTFGQGGGGILRIQANVLEVSGEVPSGESTSAISTSVVGTEADGDAGRVDIQVETLRVEGGGQIINATFGQGKGGNLSIRANDVVVRGGNSLGNISSGIFASAQPDAEGDAGSLELQVDTLLVEQGGQISTRTFALGDGGSLNIQASRIEVRGKNSLSNRPSSISTATASEAEGNAGNLELQTTILLLENEGVVESSTFGRGNGGSLDLQVNTLRVEGGAQIGNGTFGQGNGGPLTIRANNIELSGADSLGESPSGIFASTEALIGGQAGSIDLQADTLRVEGGARIRNNTFGQGDGGPISIQARSLTVSGVEASIGSPSGISANAGFEAEGDAGKIEIAVESLQVTDGAFISVSSDGSGNASDLNIVADQILLTDRSILEARIVSGEKGNIFLTVDDFLLMRGGSLISANAENQADGSNITIDSPIILGLEDSDIIANAVGGSGGNINITTQALLGLQFRDEQTAESDITASSQAGLDGTVTINLSETELDTDTVELPTDVVDTSDQVGQRLCAGGRSSFTAIGRGGLPASPYDSLSGHVTWEDWYVAESSDDSVAVNESDRTTITPDASTETSGVLVEAQDWRLNSQGDVVLTAAIESDSRVELSDGVSCRQVREEVK